MITPKMVFDEYALKCGWSDLQKFFEEQPCDAPHKSLLQKIELCEVEILTKLFSLAKSNSIDKSLFESLVNAAYNVTPNP